MDISKNKAHRKPLPQGAFYHNKKATKAVSLIERLIAKPMEQSQYRDELHRYIDSANEQMLRILHAIMREDTRTGKRKPLTPAQFTADIKEAEAQIQRGEYMNLEDFEKASEKWD